jgi:hypothetical protein
VNRLIFLTVLVLVSGIGSPSKAVALEMSSKQRDEESCNTPCVNDDDCPDNQCLNCSPDLHICVGGDRCGKPCGSDNDCPTLPCINCAPGINICQQ